MSEFVKEVKDAEFQAAVASGTTVIDFWAPWCGPCKAIAPLLEELADEYGGRLVVAKMNVDEEKEVASEYGIMSIPTLLLFKDGKLVAKKAGSAPKAALKEFVEQGL
jgi:thioredoxin 1